MAKKVIGPTRQGLALIKQARDASKQEIEKAKDDRTKDLRQQHDTLATRVAAEESTITRVTKELQEIDKQLESLRADVQAEEFIKKTRDSTEYTKHFGVIARARHDFQQLTNLLDAVETQRKDAAKEAAAAKAAGKPTADGAPPKPVPQIDRIILYIDDLDRCPEDKVVDVLQAVHLLLAFPLFIVVVGVDSRWLLHSLRKRAVAFQQNREDDDIMDEEERVHWESTPFNYLEKIFQIPFNLQPMDSTGFGRLIDGLTKPEEESTGTVTALKDGTTPLPGKDTGLQQPARQPQTPAQEPPGAAVTPQSKTPAQDAAQVGASIPSTQPAPIPASTATPAQMPPPASPATMPPQPPSTAPTPVAKKTVDIDPNPEFLQISDTERKFMRQMHRLIPTPRAAKRYVNVYRLLRATLPAKKRDELEAYVHECQWLLLMLAIITGFPQEGTVILRELVERQPEGTWWKFVDDLAREYIDAAAKQEDASTLDRRGGEGDRRRKNRNGKPADGASPMKDDSERRQRAQRWEDLQRRLGEVRALIEKEGAPKDPACSQFTKWSTVVARYSFESGRVLTAARG